MTPMNLRYYISAITLELDPARCVGCGRCVEVCPHDVFALVRSSSDADRTPDSTRQPHRQSQIVHRDRCMECGACARNCAAEAIQAGAGVGCAAAIINGLVRGTAPDCDCGGGKRPTAGCATRGDCGGNS